MCVCVCVCVCVVLSEYFVGSLILNEHLFLNTFKWFWLFRFNIDNSIW